MIMRKLFVLLIVGLLVSSCSTIKSNVISYNVLGNYKSGKTYIFLPLEEQVEKLEYKTFSSMIAEKLLIHGFTLAEGSNEPDIIIAFGYYIDDGVEQIGSTPIIGQTGVSSSSSTGTIYSSGNTATYRGSTSYRPSYGVVGSRTYSYTEYKRTFWMKFIDRKSINGQLFNTIYDVQVVSSGSTPQIQPIVPYMINAIFKDFPGVNGKSRSVISLYR